MLKYMHAHVCMRKHMYACESTNLRVLVVFFGGGHVNMDSRCAHAYKKGISTKLCQASPYRNDNTSNCIYTQVHTRTHAHAHTQTQIQGLTRA
jgi:hypothetical protein